ncbi:helix-turn-helix domain-containing protein [Dyadobacter sp. LHD-138]|uniref:helix-turn-helix domain-containing protein n=1 Tax=Dyadobacter sp. LHD-138 TaxID=3071413 RepID=UPI0027DF4B5A|nr:helix-turn-helix domain-containing protein [Dyadobacter sp. LHD-138]MDQ6482568.1 helix-turn-helix domain-containing protein [Dyadobacter sp. LHD-138]
MTNQEEVLESIKTMLLGMELLLKQIAGNNPMLSTNSSSFLTVQEASDLLCIAKPTLYAKVSKREVPHFKRGKKLLFKKSDLVNIIEGSKRKTYQEIREESEQRRAKLK